MKKTNNVMKPRMELAELYQGIPDESVNLTFQDLAKLNHSENKTRPPLSPEPVSQQVHSSPRHLIKIPSIEFKTGLHTLPSDDNRRHVRDLGCTGGGGRSPRGGKAGGDVDSGYSTGYDDMSTASGRSGGRRRRPGIPHSKICTICSTYVYVFRTRCLVCGRVYCRQCLEMGMGDMIEGRKCIECLGLRFSQRYIEKAGNIWCWQWRYPSTMKQVELKWAEKGPIRTGDRGCKSHYSGMASSISKSPRARHVDQPSFVASSSYSPYDSPSTTTSLFSTFTIYATSSTYLLCGLTSNLVYERKEI